MSLTLVKTNAVANNTYQFRESGSWAYPNNVTGQNGFYGPNWAYSSSVGASGEFFFDEDHGEVTAGIPYRVLFTYPDDTAATRDTAATWNIYDSDMTTSLASGALDETAVPNDYTFLPSTASAPHGLLGWKTMSASVTPSGTRLKLKLVHQASGGANLILGTAAIQPTSETCPPTATYTITASTLTPVMGQEVVVTIRQAGPLASGTITLTPSVGSAVVSTCSDTGRAIRVSFFPTAAGTITITPTNSASLTNPSPISITVTAATGLIRTGSGLLYEPDATWTRWKTREATTAWTVKSVKTMVAHDPFSRVLFSKSGATEVAGTREAQLFVESTQLWWMLYDTGDGSTGWRERLAYSTDRGLTWTRQADIPPSPNTYNKATTGTWAAVANGWIEKWGSTWYLHRVTTANTEVGTAQGLPQAPYFYDILTASTINGTWTTAGDVPLADYTLGTATQFVPGSTVKVSSTYHHIGQIATAALGYVIVRFTGTTPAGPWTSQEIIEDVGGTVENPKAFFNAVLNAYVVIGNAYTTVADRNWIKVASAITGFAAIEHNDFQWPLNKTGALEGPVTVGVPCPINGPDGTLQYDSTYGYTPFTFDGFPTDTSDTAHTHIDRSIRGAVLEPSLSSFTFNDATATVTDHSVHELAHTDIVIEFTVRIRANGSLFVDFRTNGSGSGVRAAMGATGIWTLAALFQSSAGWSTTSSGQGTSTGTTNAPSYRNNRVRITAIANVYTIYMNGEACATWTDGGNTYTSGSYVVLGGVNGTYDVRNLTMRSSNTVTITGLPASSDYIARSAGSLPAFSGTASGGGTATFALAHSPLKGIEVGTSGLASADAIPYDGRMWGGDTFAYAAPASGPATAYTLTGPSSGTIGVQSTDFDIAVDGTSTDTLTISDGGDGGSLTHTSLSWSASSSSQTFKYTPVSTGVKTITVTSANGLPVTGSPFTFAVSSGSGPLPDPPAGSAVIHFGIGGIVVS